MSFTTSLVREIFQDGTIAFVAGLAVLYALVRAPEERVRLRWTVYPLALHLVTLPVAALFGSIGSPVHPIARLVALVLAGICGVGLSAMFLFGLLLPLVGIRVPRIVRDVVVGTGSIVASLVIASQMGFNVTGLIATSAILTAALALSMQDTLGNIIGGLALQIDKSIAVGDWIRFESVSGRVTEISWRHATIETRNWETLIVPNSALVKGSVLIVGRRAGQPPLWRRWVYFNVDFRFPPSHVIRAVEEALASPIPNVSDEPRAHCILYDLQESYARYAARYWLSDLAQDDGTDSAVRRRIVVALRRAEIPLSMPAHAVFLTEESAERKTQKSHMDIERRLDALCRVELFRSLSDRERRDLAPSLRYTPFVAGEVLTRQGAEAHWLYMLVSGEVSVRVAIVDAGEREVSRLGAGDFFGEAALLTGEPRNATVVALSDVTCLRLDRERFLEIFRQRPDVAMEVADILARRKVELQQLKEQVTQEVAARRLEEHKHDFLKKIRQVLGLGDE
ncbi:MAG: mechanosensitive ion channel family protein [Myxococcales bacterium]|nr:mechanosensitive ion channel family protein [Myxococcales bacterium]